MKLSCAIIQDLLPLYHDGICAPDTAAAVEEHLRECAACREIFHNLKEGEKLAPAPAEAASPETAALRKVKRKLLRKYVTVALCVLLVCAGLITGVMMWMNTARVSYPAEDLLHVQYTTEPGDGDFAGEILQLTFTEDSPQAGLHYRAIPLDENDKDTEWVLLMSRDTTLAMALSAKLRFPPWEFENAGPNLFNVRLNWKWYAPDASPYGVEPPKEKWDSFISKVYYFDDYSVMDRLQPELSPEERMRLLQENATMIWERSEDLH